MIKVAVVTPIYRNEISEIESIALDFSEKYLSQYCRFQLSHPGVQVRLEGFVLEEFKSDFFSSVEMYSKLLLSQDFYDRFRSFDFVLVYQLDAAVFSKSLDDWLSEGIDFIGAPLFKDGMKPDEGFLGVGNGGFSLRRVKTFLAVLNSNNFPRFSVALSPTRWMPDLSVMQYLKRVAKAVRIIRAARRGVEWFTANYTLNEDKFWSFRARLFDPSFRIAPVEKALEFSFECFPRYCYELNGRRLPFGCHAWAKHDRAFWEQFIDVKGAS